jgi:hypothetical protein
MKIMPSRPGNRPSVVRNRPVRGRGVTWRQRRPYYRLHLSDGGLRVTGHGQRVDGHFPVCGITPSVRPDDEGVARPAHGQPGPTGLVGRFVLPELTVSHP